MLETDRQFEIAMKAAEVGQGGERTATAEKAGGDDDDDKKNKTLPNEMQDKVSAYDNANGRLMDSCAVLDKTLERAGITSLMGEGAVLDQASANPAEAAIARAVQEVKSTLELVRDAHIELAAPVRYIDKLIVDDRSELSNT